MYRKDGNLTSILRNKIELWENGVADTMNELGQFPKEDKLIRSLYAAVIPQTGSMLNNRTAETVLTRTTHKIICRYDENIKPSQWFMIDGQRYNILYIIDPYLNRERLEIFCEWVVL